MTQSGERKIVLRGYQQKSANLIASSLYARKFALDRSVMGTGKTFASLDAVAQFEEALFAVVCRASARNKWKKAVEDYGLSDRCLGVDSWNKWTSGNYYRDLVTKGGQKKKDAQFSWTPSASTIVIFDEVQDAGGHDTLNAKLLMGAGRSPYIYPIGLSATIADSPLKLKAVGFLCGLHNLTNFYGWCLDMGCGKSPFGYNQLYFRKGAAEWVIPLLHSFLAPFGPRVTVDEVREFLPPETIETELWDCGTPGKLVKEALDHLEEIRDTDLERHEDDTPGAVEQMRDRQEAELRKLQPLAQEIEDAVEGGYYCPVFLNFIQSIETLRKMLNLQKIECGIYTGQNPKVRERDLDLFMEGKRQVIVLQTQAGGASIDLHDLEGSRPRMTFLSPTYHAEVLIQALGRTVRFDARSPVIQRIVFAEGTIEEKVYKAVKGKAERIRALNDGEWKNAFGA